MHKNLYSLGFMSGTSTDGVDASIIKSDGEEFVDLIDDFYIEYDQNLRLRLQRLTDSCFSKNDFLKLSKDFNEVQEKITQYHIKAYKKIISKNKNLKLDLIGFPGQTILHKPRAGYTIQIGDYKLLSQETKKTVIYNFRENDILNGGEGAPLSPLYHRTILKKTKSKFPMAIINIGGISNITYAETKDNISSFDIGPGNILINKWVSLKSKMKFDDKGLLAKSGNVKIDILKILLDNYYINKKFSKSLDIKDFKLNNLEKLNLEDGCATLSMLTIKSICIAIQNLKKLPKKIFFCGGGRKNNFIIESIKKEIKSKIFMIEEINLNGDFIESQAFAYLAVRSYLKKYITLPETTGVKKPCLGGTVYKN